MIKAFFEIMNNEDFVPPEKKQRPKRQPTTQVNSPDFFLDSAASINRKPLGLNNEGALNVDLNKEVNAPESSDKYLSIKGPFKT